MKTLSALLTLAALLCLATPALAQQSLSGAWSVESINSTQTPEGVTLTFNFASNGTATLSYAFDGEPALTWNYTFTVEEGRVTLAPAKPFAKAQTVEYDIQFKAGKLLLLPPKTEEDEPAEDKADDTAQDKEKDPADPATDPAANTEPDKTDSDPAAQDPAAGDQDPDKKQDEKKEDTRKPVWVLVSAS